MTPRRVVHRPLALGLIAGLIAARSVTVIGGISARSIEGQEGWSGGTLPVSASIDQTVDQSGLNQRTGIGAWRISNNTSLGGYNGNFAGWPFSPGLPVSAGQPSSGAVADQFTATLWFRSASAAADGSNIEIDLGTVPGDDRNTFLALTNRADGADGGLQLRASEPDGVTGGFHPTVPIATGITRGVYHRLDIVAKFFDGPANDTVEYALDGVALVNPRDGGLTFGTFEGYRDSLGLGYALSNRLFFRSGGAPSASGAFVDTAAQGFYFDDLFYAVASQSAPAIRLAAYATGFEPGFSAGSIQSQEGWSGGKLPIAASVDQAVDLAGVNQRTGQGFWRISNNTSLGGYNGNFAGWPFSPGLPVSAGQPSSGAVADQFTATLWFRSASAAADGSNIEIDLGTVPGDDRNTFLAVTNRADGADGGLQLRASEPDGVTGGFHPTVPIATGITRGVYHRLDIVAKFFDGPANDTVEYALDGVALVNPRDGGLTFGTFEGFRDSLGSGYALSNRLFFRSGGAPSASGAFVDTAAQGFYFDDLFYAVAHQSAPGTALAAYATGFEPPAIPAPDLTISKSHVGNFTQGQIGAQFTVTVTNSGTPSTIGVVTLTDTLPTGLTPTAASGAGWTCPPVAGATVTCTRSDALAPGASYPPVTIIVNVAASAPASVANTATISGGGDVNTANNTATDVTTILPGASQVDLGVTKTDGHTTYTPGTPISYTITVTNAGPSTATGFSIADNVPPKITSVSVGCAITGTGNCGMNGSSGNIVSFTAASLAPGAGNLLTLTVNGTVSPNASGALVNMVTVTAGAGAVDVTPGNNSATDTNQQEAGVIFNDGGDFDGDGQTDIAVFRPSTGEWWIINSSTATWVVQAWGVTGDVPVPGDYDGDGKADIAVFRPSTMEWWIINSSTATWVMQAWGVTGDVPVPGDYDGDGKADIAVFRPSTMEWWIINSSTATWVMQAWGVTGDVPVPGDYDGDGKADIAVFRPSTGEWWIINSSTATWVMQAWGVTGDVPVPGDYDGDGKADIAVFRPSTMEWWIINSSTATWVMQAWGVAGDVPVPGDYDGDGKADIAVFRPSTGEWWIINSSTATWVVQTWGGDADIPTRMRP